MQLTGLPSLFPDKILETGFFDAVYLTEEDLARGRRLVEAFRKERGVKDGDGPWSCASCGEENDASFDVCWSCQAARSASS